MGLRESGNGVLGPAAEVGDTAGDYADQTRSRVSRIRVFNGDVLG